MPSSRKRVAAALGLGVAVSGLSLVSLPAANAVSTGLVISEVYGGGGNTGATFTNDFIELYNPTSEDISLSGMSVQYRSSTNTGTGVTPLGGTVAAGEHYLIQQAAGTGGTDPLPTPDATGTLAMGGASGVVFLASTTNAVTLTSGNNINTPNVVDLVGYGTANTFETAATGTALTNLQSVSRSGAETDTDDNAADFTEISPAPQNCGAACAAPDADRTIAEIQGTGDASPDVGATVTTEGVVTARYPTGGYTGFYIQTGGTGGATDATPGASDAIFVFGPELRAGQYPALGTSVEVTGEVSEFFGTTEITTEAEDIVELGALPAVTPLATAWSNLDTGTEKEAHEGEILAPQGAFTVTDSYDIDNFGEIGLAQGNKPLIQPTDVEDFQEGDPGSIVADNAVRAITLDDGASINFRDVANQDTAYPWLSPSNPVRVGANVTFIGNVVLEFRNNLWKFQPRQRVLGEGASTATFEKTRTDAPEAVGGDLRISTFNVLNYFPTTGVEFDAMPGTTCTYFRDRDGNRTTVNSCTPDGPRGAADPVNLERQESKIVAAINALDASVVSLEEIENSVKFGKNRDFALSTLVAALNEDAGAGTWAFAPSPPASLLPPLAEQDVIRNAFIYKPGDVKLDRPSWVLRNSAPFANAREPLAQAFRPAGGSEGEAFAVIVNHFKSKSAGGATGDNVDTGQGAYNGDRTRQAAALSDFAEEFAYDRQIEAVFLAGDFNSYTEEDPMQVLYDDGYTNLKSTTDPAETSYSFNGLSGSLDHVVANDAAAAMVTGVDLWNINAEEAVAYEYSRYNSNVTQLYDGETPYKASDHNPEIVGLDFAGFGSTDIQILATNDFHGRIVNNVPTPVTNPAGGPEAGAAVLAGAVKQLRERNPKTVFAAAGDLIGASTFDSFIQKDKPTIDALNEAGLEVSAVGNHEFDQGYDDLTKRVMAPYDAEDNPFGGAEWKYLGANVVEPENQDLIDATWIKEMDGVQVGFVGAVTEHLEELVSPAGIEGVDVTDIVAATNAAADGLKAEGADVVVLLVHEGAPGTDCAVMDDDPSSDFGSIINGVNENVDAIVSGHTHLAYNCSFPVEEWAGRPVTERPVVSAGQYGVNLNKLVFTVDEVTGEVQAKNQSILALKSNPATPNYPADPATAEIVADAVATANELGEQPLGQIAAPLLRGKLVNGTTENRGAESTLGNMVAEVQQWATETPEAGGAQIAFMNPGGLRADMAGNGSGTDPRTVTYRQAAEVQPFANTLVNMQLTGAAIEEILEQQWQPAGSSRPFLRLGVSEGFTYTYDPPVFPPPAGEKGEVTGMWLDGVAIDPNASYSVTANSFLASGGDNFGAFTQATEKRDTGKVDLQGMVDYLAEFANPDEGDAPLPVNYTQRAVGVEFEDPEAVYAPGDEVEFDLTSWSFTNAADQKDTEVVVSLDGEELGTDPLDNTVQAALPGYDEQGTATVAITLPADVPGGAVELTLTGATTGTEIPVIIQVEEGDTTVDADITVDHRPNRVFANSTRPYLDINVTADGVTPTGRVEVRQNGALLRAGNLSNGSVTLRLPAFTSQGEKTLVVSYLGSDTVNPAQEQYVIQVERRRNRGR